MCSLTVAQGTAVKHRQVQVHAIFFSFFDAHDVVQVDEEEHSLATECVLLLQNVFSYYRMCSDVVQVDEEEHSIEMHLPYIKKVMAGA